MDKIKAINTAIDCYGTSEVYAARRKRIIFKLNVINFIQFAVPVSVFVVISTVSITDNSRGAVLVTAGILGGIQALASLWAMVAGWGSSAERYKIIKTHNMQLATDLEILSRETEEWKFNQAWSDAEGRLKAIKLLEAEDELTDIEKRHGLRIGLHRFQVKCGECNQVPSLKKPSLTCSACGQ